MFKHPKPKGTGEETDPRNKPFEQTLQADLTQSRTRGQQ